MSVRKSGNYISEKATSSAMNYLLIPLLCGFILGCSNSTKLEWHQEDQYRWAEIKEGFFESDATGFVDLSSSQTNITFSNDITEQELSDNRHYLNGSGVAAGDVDGDGLVDLYFAGLKNSNKLYKNLGHMEFQDVTETAGVAHENHYSTGAVFADVNGDTHLDLLVSSIYKDIALYINDGKGNFEIDENSGLGPGEGSTTMTLADIDGDNDLDLYVAKYKEKSVKDIYTTEELEWNTILNEPYTEQQQTGPYTLIPPFDEHYEIFMDDNNRLAGLAETGQVDDLYLNEGGKFEEVSDTKNVFRDENGNPYGLQPDWGLTAKFQDLNGDGLPDLYVCNDFFTKDRVWMNQGAGTFRSIDSLAIRNLSFACMGVDMSDINRDGRLDIFTAEMLSSEHDERLQQVGSDDPNPDQYRETEARPTNNRNSLYLQREDHTYAEISYLSGVEATGWSWDATFMDINLDGFEDLIVNNGYLYHILDMDAQIGMMRQGRNMDEHFTEFMQNAPSLDLQNRVLMNNGDLTFRDQSAELGFTEKDISHGMAVADLDNDGALDLAINRMNGEAGIFRNRTTKPRIAVRLIGEAPNTQAIGAKVKLEGGPVVQQKELSSGGDFLSGSDPFVVFAADQENRNHQLTITWPDGRRTHIDSLRSSRIYEIQESESQRVENESETAVASRTPIFEDVSDRINHRHDENDFQDFQLQSLLPVSMSKLGPGISWIDLDGDQDDDLYIGAGMEGKPGVFENMGKGSFRSMSLEGLEQTTAGDQTAAVGWHNEGRTNMVVGSANYEQGQLRVPSAYQYHNGQGGGQLDSLTNNISTTGPLSAADYDNDGDIDLFVGGRFIPGHYPMDAPSRLFTNENGSFVIDKVNSQKLQKVGMVTGSLFTDFDRDGDQDLVLSREWDSVMLLENDGGIFRDVSEQNGLSDLKGWWNGIASGDFNNDGYPDLIATNKGLNSPYQLEMNKPLRMYYSDFNGDQWVEVIESYADGNGDFVPRKRLYKYGSVPVIANRMRSHEQFANTTLNELFGQRLNNIPYKEVSTLQHTLFLRTENGFEARPLPLEAQFSVAYHAGVADMDNDGNEDLFLSQNLFALPRQVPRQDAGRGLWLRGDGEGNLTPVPGSISGVKVYGEQRGAAFSDFNKDGRVDLAVSQNDYNTKLYLNRTESRGYRITLRGPAVNTDAIGSSIRLVYEDQSAGPVREIQAGSGYWSQNSFTQVMGAGSDVSQIQVNWFDGRQQTVEIEKGKMDYVISYPEN
ncbi:FG-GAP-like repeat-containing protein [Aliifodinibius sp. S!AR15-10]|uniref:FG-GAP-like repeat-containing protein n=1 Tax=Aliifodinibius sp. S!AR15-10 TaxID=2950437 RepID=UPI0028610BBA|nr:FG-GAP-like repeat-containing protein [Aliifodinibius sp. S!AR15-10]MDR8393430.1 FG-GAP-like repeat-containing protein [Aliifodinibius sp. S!AR15-10]